MTYYADMNQAEGQDENRRIIRVDNAPDQAGIAAALRRAFDSGRVEELDDDFINLLDRLN